MKSRVDRFTDDCELNTLEKKMIEGHNRPYVTTVVSPATMATDGVELNLEDVGGAFRFPY